MKIIFSRKGFDSKYGGGASPIFPSGELLTLPIPEPFPGRHSTQYKDICASMQAGGLSLGTLVHDLTKGKIKPERFAHLDPDLNPSSIPRPADWRPVFGQEGAAETHLQKHDVEKDDVFVFYGWFRKVELVSGTYRYVSGALDLHVIFGWLQVEQRLCVDNPSEGTIPEWARYHPHCQAAPYHPNSMYISTSRLQISGREIGLLGAGVFPRFDSKLCLTASGQSRRSIWRLPSWFSPRSSCLSYHSKMCWWDREGDTVLLQTASPGQEFVLDCQVYPEAIEWLYHLFSLSGATQQT